MDAVEAGRVAGELAARQVWFRLPERLRVRAQERLRRRGATDHCPVVSGARLREHLQRCVPAASRLLMVHSSSDRFQLADDRGTPLPGPRGALEILGILKALVGSDGTLCMPTHPLYADDPGYLFDKSDLVLRYSPRRTPSSVGLLTELFRRDANSMRSAHPLSSLTARGPDAASLLRDNLNSREPLPHGIDSGYYRFCREGGTVLGLGLDLLKFLTILHVAEEVRDADWPVPGFFYRRRFLVESEKGWREVLVRERRPEFVRGLSHRRLRRDLLAEGVLRETQVDGVRIDTVDSKSFLEFIMEKQKESPYPYYLPTLARIGTPPRAVAAR